MPLLHLLLLLLVSPHAASPRDESSPVPVVPQARHHDGIRASKQQHSEHLQDGNDRAVQAHIQSQRRHEVRTEFNKTVDSPGRCEKGAAWEDRRPGHCELDLSGYSSRTHVADVAQHQWLLPSLLEQMRGARAHAGLRQLIGQMSLPPQQRPTFSCALERLARLHVD